MLRSFFYYVVLCSYANFRTSYRRIDGISYTVYPGEWICSITDITEWFRVRFHYQAFAILKSLQDRQLITFTRLGRGHIVKFSITDWRRNNTALDYNCPCQKDSGFFFIPVSTATELISAGRASEMDVILDLWISAIYKDQQVRGSEIGPVAYFRNGTGNPIVNYSELSARWGISRSSVGRLLKKLADFDYLSLLTFPGRSGTVIYLKNYLSTMFQISDVMIDKRGGCYVSEPSRICARIPFRQSPAQFLMSRSAFQQSFPAFQNLTCCTSFGKCCEPLKRKAFPAFHAQNPNICYIHYPTTAR